MENYQNTPELIPRLENPGNHGACYVPRSLLETGIIDIHEMAWGQANALWGVNTRFSCLCTFDFDNSFIPRWRPRFISALGNTDTAGGWRKNKRDGGLLMDVPQNRILFDRLSMPHSPRWYRNTLWMLESGRGSLVRFNMTSGKKTEVARMPGFTRGMDFAGPLVFIGLSKARETATFSDFPLLEELEERTCGVYVVNIETGNVISLIRFEGDVEEIFAVQVLRHRFPELLERDDERLQNSYMVPKDRVQDFQIGKAGGTEKR